MSEFVILATGNFFTRFLFGVVFFLLGLTLVSRLDASPKPMGRFVFGVIYVFAATMGNAGTYVWSMVSASSIDTATWVYLGWVFCFLALMAFGSRRRSLDAYGDTGQAFYACIPIMNLILLFKSPANDRTTQRSALALTGRTAVFMIVLILAFFPAAIMMGIGKERSAPPNLMSVSPDRAARIQALITNAQTPLVIDQNTMLTGATSNGMNVILQYDVFGASFEQMTGQLFATIMAPILQESACSDQNFRYIIHNGGSIIFNYRMLRTDGINDASVTINSCQ